MFNAPPAHTKKPFKPPPWFKPLVLVVGTVWIFVELAFGKIYFAITAALLVALAAYDLKNSKDDDGDKKA